MDELRFYDNGHVTANLSTGVVTGQSRTDRLRNIENLVVGDDGLSASFTGDGETTS